MFAKNILFWDIAQYNALHFSQLHHFARWYRSVISLKPTVTVSGSLVFLTRSSSCPFSAKTFSKSLRKKSLTVQRGRIYRYCLLLLSRRFDIYSSQLRLSRDCRTSFAHFREWGQT